MHSDQPPSYDAATGSNPGTPRAHFVNEPLPLAGPSTPLLAGDKLTGDKKAAPDAPAPVRMPAPAPFAPTPAMSPGGTRVYRYQHPATGEVVASLLPPDHPQMVCLQEGRHLGATSFGLLGILAAVFWFPLGVGLCLLDRRVKCRRCGMVVESGLCG